MEKTDKAIEVLKAFKEGKIIEFKSSKNSNEWMQITSYWNLMGILQQIPEGYQIRIKQQPIYQPYVNAKEFMLDYIKHHNLIKDKFCENLYFSILRFNDSGFSCVINGEMESYNMLFKQYVWGDTLEPCGTLITE